MEVFDKKKKKNLLVITHKFKVIMCAFLKENSILPILFLWLWTSNNQ